MKSALLMAILQLAANGADAYATDRNMHRQRFVEYDPLARPFVRDRATFVTASALQAAGALLLERRLRRGGRRRWARALELAAVGGHAYGAAISRGEVRQ